jgi:hypothetical protein
MTYQPYCWRSYPRIWLKFMLCRYAVNQARRWWFGRDGRGSPSLGLHIIGYAVSCALVADEIKILVNKHALFTKYLNINLKKHREVKCKQCRIYMNLLLSYHARRCSKATRLNCKQGTQIRTTTLCLISISTFHRTSLDKKILTSRISNQYHFIHRIF